MFHSPLITICVSTYNRQDYLRNCLQSLIDQTFSSYEIIVVDDGSTDNTEEMVHAEFPQVRYFYKPNGGDASAKNMAVQNARGQFIVFQDSDDLFYPDTLERLWEPIQAGRAECSYGQYSGIDACGNAIPVRDKMKHYPSGMIISSLIEHIIVHNTAFLIPKVLFEEAGGFSSRFRVGYDYALALAICAGHTVEAVPGALFQRRRHAGTISQANYQKIGQLLEIILDFQQTHPELAQQYREQFQKRIFDLETKLAREAHREKMPRPCIHKHLHNALHYHFSGKNCLRLLLWH